MQYLLLKTILAFFSSEMTSSITIQFATSSWSVMDCVWKGSYHNYLSLNIRFPYRDIPWRCPTVRQPRTVYGHWHRWLTPAAERHICKPCGLHWTDHRDRLTYTDSCTTDSYLWPFGAMVTFRFLWVSNFSSANSGFTNRLRQLQKLNLLGLETQVCNPSYSRRLGQEGHDPEVCLHYRLLLTGQLSETMSQKRRQRTSWEDSLTPRTQKLQTINKRENLKYTFELAFSALASESILVV